MSEKSLGQIAFEAYYKGGLPWIEETLNHHETWERCASAIAAEVRRRDGEKQLPLIPKPEWVLSSYESVAAMAMQGLLSNPEYFKRKMQQVAGCGDEESATFHCSVMDALFTADAFFAESEKRRNNAKA